MPFLQNGSVAFNLLLFFSLINYLVKYIPTTPNYINNYARRKNYCCKTEEITNSITSLVFYVQCFRYLRSIV